MAEVRVSALTRAWGDLPGTIRINAMARKQYVISTTQRCGSTCLTRMLERMTASRCIYLDCAAMGFALDGAVASEEAMLRLELALQEIETGVIKTHDLPTLMFDAIVQRLPHVRLLTVRRDFKDVVVSRFFYYKCYWPTDPSLGPLSPSLEAYFRGLEGLDDREAILTLFGTDILFDWAREWAAFEPPFQTDRALRMTFEQITSPDLGVARSLLEGFTGREWVVTGSFQSRQEGETSESGRIGPARFYRSGRTGQFREWFTDLQCDELDLLAARELRRLCANASEIQLPKTNEHT